MKKPVLKKPVLPEKHVKKHVIYMTFNKLSSQKHVFNLPAGFSIKPGFF
jgi:hypothetical protein